MKNSFCFLTALILTISVNLAGAQDSDTARRGWFRHDMHNIAGTFQIQATYRHTYMGPLNRILGADGLPALGNNDIWFNLSTNHIHNNWIIEDGVGFTPWTTASANGIKTSFNQYQAFLKFGYNVCQSADFRLFPFAGINVSAAVLNIEDNNNIKRTSDFSTELTNSSISKTFYQPNFGIELGGGFDYMIKMSKKTIDCFTIERSIPIGVRAGYYINAAHGDWRVDNNYKLADGPYKNQSQFFVSVNIGLGYALKK